MSANGTFPAGVTGNEREITGDTSGLFECSCGSFSHTSDHLHGLDFCYDCANEIRRLQGELEAFGLTICEKKD